MNAVERLWRALRKDDWDAALAQLHEHAVIRWPHTGERFDRAIDYVTAHRLHGGRTRVDVRRVISESRDVAVYAVIGDAHDVWHVTGIYELQDGRIAHGTEVWTREDVERPAGLG
jgi:limonene-1,2-epoxide hydrolase